MNCRRHGLVVRALDLQTGGPVFQSLVHSLVSAFNSESSFSPHHKRRSHKRNPYSGSDSFSLIFTKSYHSTLLITTPTKDTLCYFSNSFLSFKLMPGNNYFFFISTQGTLFNHIWFAMDIYVPGGLLLISYNKFMTHVQKI